MLRMPRWWRMAFTHTLFFRRESTGFLYEFCWSFISLLFLCFLPSVSPIKCNNLSCSVPLQQEQKHLQSCRKMFFCEFPLKLLGKNYLHALKVRAEQRPWNNNAAKTLFFVFFKTLISWGREIINKRMKKKKNSHAGVGPLEECRLISPAKYDTACKVKKAKWGLENLAGNQPRSIILSFTWLVSGDTNWRLGPLFLLTV